MPDGGISVAVVGGGPAGIAAAWWLASWGVPVELFEAGHTPGGVLAWGIPDYVLPSEIAMAELTELLSSPQIRITTGFTVGRDADLDRLLADHNAVVLAHGASLPPELDIPGSSLTGVHNARDFLEQSRNWLSERGIHKDSQPREHPSVGKETASGRDGHPGTGEREREREREVAGQGEWEGNPAGRVLVLGGGDTAMAVCRTAARLGMQAVSVRRSTESSARVRHDEVSQARLEGVDVRFSTFVERLEGSSEGAVKAARLRSQNAGKARHHLLKKTIPAMEVLAVDCVVIATGFKVDQSVAGQSTADGNKMPSLPLHSRTFLASRLKNRLSAGGMLDRKPTANILSGILKRENDLELAAHPVMERCWVIGDALAGPSSVVEAMAHGRQAAMNILSVASMSGNVWHR